jgi:hypothetical protein
MDSQTITLQAILSESSKSARNAARRKGILPSCSAAADPLTLSILAAAESGSVSGATLSAAALSQSNLRVPADQAYFWACSLASPRITRHNLLSSPQVLLPDPPPSMWEAEFSLTEVGRLVLAGIIPNCLINGIESQEAKMPPIRASGLARAVALLQDSCSEGELESCFLELDFGSPCVVEFSGSENWPHTGRGWVSQNAMVESSSNSVVISMVPGAWSQESAVERVSAVVEDVPGVKSVSPVRSRSGLGFDLEVSCRNESSATSAAEALIACSPLKTRQKVLYMGSDGSGERVAVTPAEILRAFVENATRLGHRSQDVIKALENLDSGSRCVSRKRENSVGYGPYVLWAIDGSGRNRVMPLTSIRCQSSGGRGSSLGGEQLKLLSCTRVRARAAIIGMFGSASSLDARPPDSQAEWMHPAETLPQGTASPCAVVTPESNEYVVLAMASGLVKKMTTQSLCGSRRGTRQCAKIDAGDVPVASASCSGPSDIVLITALGQVIRFSSDKLRESGPAARGVSGIALKEGDRLASVVVVPQDIPVDIISLLSTGKAARLSSSELLTQNRAGGGVRGFEVEDPARIVGATTAPPESELLVGTTNAWAIRFRATDIPATPLPAQFHEAISMDSSATATSLCMIPSETTRMGGDAQSPENPPTSADIPLSESTKLTGSESEEKPND